MHKFIEAQQVQPVGGWNVLTGCGTESEDGQCPGGSQQKGVFVRKLFHGI